MHFTSPRLSVQLKAVAQRFHFVGEYFFKGERQHVEYCGRHCPQLFNRLVAVALYDHIYDGAVLCKADYVQSLKALGTVIAFTRERYLDLKARCAQVLNIAFKNDTALVQKRQLIAGVLKLCI